MVHRARLSLRNSPADLVVSVEESDPDRPRLFLRRVPAHRASLARRRDGAPPLRPKTGMEQAGAPRPPPDAGRLHRVSALLVLTGWQLGSEGRRSRIPEQPHGLVVPYAANSWLARSFRDTHRHLEFLRFLGHARPLVVREAARRADPRLVSLHSLDRLVRAPARLQPPLLSIISPAEASERGAKKQFAIKVQFQICGGLHGNEKEDRSRRRRIFRPAYRPLSNSFHLAGQGLPGNRLALAAYRNAIRPGLGHASRNFNLCNRRRLDLLTRSGIQAVDGAGRSLRHCVGADHHRLRLLRRLEHDAGSNFPRGEMDHWRGLDRKSVV